MAHTYTKNIILCLSGFYNQYAPLGFTSEFPRTCQVCIYREDIYSSLGNDWDMFQHQETHLFI